MESLILEGCHLEWDAKKSIEKEILTLSSVSESLAFFEDVSEVDVAFLFRF